VVAALNAASAASRDVVVLRVLSEDILFLALWLHFLKAKGGGHTIRTATGTPNGDDTRRAYRSDFDLFQAWRDHKAVAALPAEPATVAAFLAFEADRGGEVIHDNPARRAMLNYFAIMPAPACFNLFG
jgi:hypothetical protein